MGTALGFVLPGRATWLVDVLTSSPVPVPDLLEVLRATTEIIICDNISTCGKILWTA